MFRSRLKVLLFLGLLAQLVCVDARAQAGAQPMRLVVPYAAGGPGDLVARLLADRLRLQGLQVIVDNRAGGDGAIGAAAVIQAPADGNTLLFAGAGMLTVSQHMQKSLPYDPIRDFTAISGVAYADTVFVVSPTVPARDLKEFITYAKSARPPLALASGGNGTTTHLFLELMRDGAGFEFLHVPYKGSAPALTDVMSGQTVGTITGLSITLQNIRAGKLKALALVGPQRSTAARDIPTFAEQGVAGLDIVSWWAVMAPRNTPPAVVTQLSQQVARALAGDEVRTKLEAAGITAWPLPPTEIANAIRTESERWKKLITERKLGEQ